MNDGRDRVGPSMGDNRIDAGLILTEHADITAEILRIMNGRGEEWPFSW
jgi:hypothetical protein